MASGEVLFGCTPIVGQGGTVNSTPLRRKSTAVLPGLLTAAAAVLPAYLLHWLFPWLPVLTAAVILGLLAANLPGISKAVTGPLKPGLSVGAKKLMRAGIVLLGLKVSLVDIAGLGGPALLLIVVLVLAAFAGTYLVCRAFRLPGDEPLLIASGFSICGVSAVGAMAAARRVRHEDTVVPIALVTLCGTLAIGVLPLLGSLMDLSAETFGIWAGASVHDVGQVVATAQTAGTGALAAAVVVKLARVVLLAPLAAGAGLLGRRAARGEETAGKLPPLVPLFVLGFLALIIVRTTGVLPEGVLAAAAEMQEILFAASLFALGAGVRFRMLFVSGACALAAALVSWFLIGALGLVLALLLSR